MSPTLMKLIKIELITRLGFAIKLTFKCCIDDAVRTEDIPNNKVNFQVKFTDMFLYISNYINIPNENVAWLWCSFIRDSCQ